MLTEQRIEDLARNLDRLGGLEKLLTDGLDYQTIADRLNARTMVPNPVPQGEVPIGDISAAIVDLADEMSTADITVIAAVGKQVAAAQALGAGLGGNASIPPEQYLAMLARKGLSKAVVDRLTAELKKTGPDPSWRSEVEGPVLIFPSVAPEEVQAYVCALEQQEHDAAQPAIEAELDRLRTEHEAQERAQLEAVEAANSAAMSEAMASTFAIDGGDGEPQEVE